jgi:hypothetical protein
LRNLSEAKPQGQFKGFDAASFPAHTRRMVKKAMPCRYHHAHTEINSRRPKCKEIGVI